MVVLENPNFNNSQGMRIHIRTRHHRRGSHVQSVAMRLGSDTLEVLGVANDIGSTANWGPNSQKRDRQAFLLGEQRSFPNLESLHASAFDTDWRWWIHYHTLSERVDEG